MPKPDYQIERREEPNLGNDDAYGPQALHTLRRPRGCRPPVGTDRAAVEARADLARARLAHGGSLRGERPAARLGGAALLARGACSARGNRRRDRIRGSDRAPERGHPADKREPCRGHSRDRSSPRRADHRCARTQSRATSHLGRVGVGARRHRARGGRGRRRRHVPRRSAGPGLGRAIGCLHRGPAAAASGPGSCSRHGGAARRRGARRAANRDRHRRRSRCPG